MKMRNIFLFIAAVLSGTYIQAQTATADASHTVYVVDISARNLSLKAVDSYPQKLLAVIYLYDTIKTVRISTFNPYEDKERGSAVKNAIYNPQAKYPAHISRFLKPTKYVNSRSRITENVADTLFDGTEKTCFDVITKALSFSKRTVFDSELAAALDAGKSMTEPSDSAIIHGKGTCSEATNIFLALMRRKGIPARMVVGYCYEPEYKVNGSHAWAECYIEGAGWWPVDPQNGHPSLPYFCYKLFTGKDFRDCRIKTLPDMYLRGDYHFKAVKP